MKIRDLKNKVNSLPQELNDPGQIIYELIEDILHLDESPSPSLAQGEVKFKAALEKIMSVGLTTNEAERGEYKYALNRCWHIADEALSPHPTEDKGKVDEDKDAEIGQLKEQIKDLGKMLREAYKNIGE